MGAVASESGLAKWQIYLRLNMGSREKLFHNIMFDSLDALEDQLVTGLRALEGNRTAVKSIAGWDWAVRSRCANLRNMNVVLSPIVSEFETEEQETSYNQWFRARVEEALHSEKPRLPHDVAMAKVQAKLEERRKARANPSLV